MINEIEQPDLFTGEPQEHPPHNDTDTSIGAARKQIGKAAQDRAKILAFLEFLPSTDEEMKTRLKMDENTLRPRRWELSTSGKIVDSGKRRNTHTGSPAIVWKVK